VVDNGAGVRRITAGEVEIEIDQLSEMEEIWPTYARRPDFESDLGFCCFGLMISGEWLSGRLGFCCLVLMAVDFFFFFFFFFWFDFRRLDCCCFGLLIFFFSHFGFLNFWFDGFESGYWVITSSGLYVCWIGRRKKTGLDVRRIGRRKKKNRT